MLFICVQCQHFSSAYVYRDTCTLHVHVYADVMNNDIDPIIMTTDLEPTPDLAINLHNQYPRKILTNIIVIGNVLTNLWNL